MLAYDALGRQTRETDAIGQAQVVQYDALRVVQLEKASGVGAYYHYDAVGQLRAEVRYPSGDVIYHNYDARGAQTAALKTSIPDQAWEYDAAGRATHHTQGDANLYYGYDGAGLRAAMALELDAVTYWTQYEQDARGLPSALGDAWNQVTYFAHDARGLPVPSSCRTM